MSFKSAWYKITAFFEVMNLIRKHGFKEAERILNKQIYEARSEYISLKLRLKELKKKMEK